MRNKRGNLVAQVSDDLRQSIQAGKFRTGDKLPSESKLTGLYDVSRTVIREAIAALRADGLVEPRQGAGVFVTEPVARDASPFQAIDFKKISSIIEMLELRAAVEIEAAGLAAQRRSPAQEEAILAAHQDILALIARAEPTVAADIDFHMAIAQATNNPRFPEFVGFMGRELIPRAALQDNSTDLRTDPAYLARIAEEHAQIATAIADGDQIAARRAMRDHLKGSQQRYRNLIRRSAQDLSLN